MSLKKRPLVLWQNAVREGLLVLGKEIKKIDCRLVLITNDLWNSEGYSIAAIWFSTALRMKAFIDTPVCFANAATRECMSGVSLTFKAPE